MKCLRFAPKALIDLAAIHAYIANDSQIVAKRVVRLVIEAIDLLKAFPQSGRKGRGNGTYEIVIPKLSLIIVYIESREAIEIVAIIHATRVEGNCYIK